MRSCCSFPAADETPDRGNLKDLTMSDPLPFPDVSESNLTILNDTYCVYEDKYGWFLWNYSTGEEETIVMFEQ